ncbi:protein DETOXIFICATION 16-like [Salvia splendens]|uniref:protein DETOXIFICATION 16-like n=1 Tax=Salvia splendens TaxID=180675 RepID=UPI001C266CE7|nr:protein DETOXIFICATION 16-like [Salvia splendens]XP_042024263.1 protein DETOXIFICATION 16-like [Salvia splendens]XP_042024264.1 protein DETOXIFICATION 16-like [Salvia splendens]
MSEEGSKPLIDHDHDQDEDQDFLEEVKHQLQLAVPLITVNILLYCLQVISLMFVGHLGELQLSGASVATSFAAVSGFSVLLGMGSALETLCGQAYGAKLYQMLGVYTQRGVVVVLALSVGLAVVWYNTSFILVGLGQDHDISAEAGVFNRWMIPSLFAYGILQCLIRFLQTQNIVLPMVVTSAVTSVFHVFLCWLLVFKLEFGSRGAAMATVASYWINVVLLALYVNFSSACAECFTGFSREAFHDIVGFLRLAVPSALMICLEYWSFEMVVILSGLLPNPTLETSVLSISLNTCWMVYMISVGLGGAVSTRVSNELGAGNAARARLAVYVAAAIAASEGVVIGAITVLVRNVWGKLYSDEEEVIVYVARILPLLALSDFLDGFQCVLSGAARGCGWQTLCAVVNLGAYYVVAIPCAVLLAFVFHLGGMGLWMGIICGLLVQAVVLIVINIRTNWDDEVTKAVNRVQAT